MRNSNSWSERRCWKLSPRLNSDSTTPRSRSTASASKVSSHADLAQQEEAFIHQVVGGVGQLQLVGGEFLVGGGVGVGAERQTQPLEDFHHLAFGHFLRAVEGHVLDEVGEALLVVGFVERSDVAWTGGSRWRPAGSWFFISA